MRRISATAVTAAISVLVSAANAGGPCPNPDHDCCTTGAPGCSDDACCNLVCGIDPFCCETAWDIICVNDANTICGDGYCPPANDACADAIPISVGVTPFITIGATTDGPTHALCNQFSFPGIDHDIWFDFIPSETGDFCIETCGSAYNTKIAVYAICQCPVGDATILACNDNLCGLQSGVVISLSAGNCYKIRVGGSVGASGAGAIRITYGGCPKGGCPNPKHDCCTQGGPGCSEFECCEAVCAVDPFCCDIAWDLSCTNQVDALCAERCASPCPNPKHSCYDEGGPGCDDERCCFLICTIDSFCCEIAWDAVCVGEANAYCQKCACPPGGSSEGEFCGQSTNAGCAAEPPLWTEIVCADQLCGDVWASAIGYDEDWFRFTITEPYSAVQISACTDFPPALELRLVDCSNPTILATGVGARPMQIAATLHPGQYTIGLRPMVSSSLGCSSPDNDYTIALDCSATCAGDVNADHAVTVHDLLLVISFWGPCTQCPADINSDGAVDVSDLLLVISAWGDCA